MIRDAFLDTARVARELVASDAVETAWNRPSAVAGMSVGALAGHLSRAITLPEQYLDVDEPADDVSLLTAAEYFASVELTDDLNAQIRERGAAEAAAGHAALVVRVDESLNRTAARLATERPDRRVASIGGRPSLLDEYLVTRIVELAVHLDDLAVSVEVETPAIPPIGWACALGCLFEIARTRHGDLAVLRALARRERDPIEALRVF